MPSLQAYVLFGKAALICALPSALYPWSVTVHQNLPEESVLYMEFQGTNQMRWAADYVKAKAGGRYSGTCVNINYSPDEMGRGNNTQCGAHGIHRVGGDKIDFIQEGTISIGKTSIPVADTHKSSLNKRLNLL